MNTSATTLILGTSVGATQANEQIDHEFETIELIELPAGMSALSYDDDILVLQFTLARVAAARVWNAVRALMISLGDAYVARERSLGIDRDTPFCETANRAVWCRCTSFRSLILCADNCDRSNGAPRDSSALAQRDAWCVELRAAMLRFVAEDTRCREADACFSEFLEEKMRVVGATSRNWLYPTKCAFESPQNATKCAFMLSVRQ